MSEEMTPAEAGNILHVIGQLEKLEQAGKLSKAETNLLNDFRAQRTAAQSEVGATSATYRGMASGALLGAKDELGGALDAITGGSYAEGRDRIRANDREAEANFPDQFSRGRLAGTGATSVLTAATGLGGARNLTLLGQMGVGGLTGLATAGGQGFMEGEGGFGPRVENATTPGLVGLGFGMGGPLVGRGAGGLARLAQRTRTTIPGLSARATNALARPIQRSEASGQDIQAYLNELGPDAMLVDGSQNLRRTGQGLAAMPGEGGETLGNALEARAAGASERITRDVNDVLGQADEAFDARVTQARERSSTLGPMYDAALEAAEPVNLGRISSVLEGQQKDAASRVSAQMRKLQNDLGLKPNAAGKIEIPEDVSALRLHNVRSDLSDDIEEARRAGRGKFVAAMSPVLKALDDELDSVPGYTAARTGYANNKAIDDAVDAGRQVFRGGEASAMSPRQLKQELENLSPAQRDAFRKGAREWVDALMGTSRNDAAAAWGAFGKDWNDEKLRILLGEKEAGKLIQRLKAENVFSQTRGAITQGSQTQMRASAAEDLADLRMPDGGQRPGPVRRGINAVSEAGNSIVDRILYAGRQDVNAQVGNLLTLQGKARDDLLQGLLAEVARRNAPTRTQRILAPGLDLATRSAGAPLAIE